MDVSMIGTVGAEQTMSLVQEILVKERYRESMNKEQFAMIMNDNPFKPVNPVFDHVLGVHDVEVVDMPEWYSDFYMQLVTSIVESIPDDDAASIEADYLKGDPKLFETPIAKKIYALKVQLKDITPKQFYEGKLPNGRKILKFCKSVYEFVNPENKDKAQSTEWYKLFESKKTTSGGLKLVISSSKSTALLLSSVFDNPSHGSCQSIHKWTYNDGNCRRLPANLVDTESVVAYVTSGNMREPINISGNKLQEKHQTMITRTILRLAYVNKVPYIIPDRAYPHNTYTSSLVKTLLDISEATGAFKVGFFSNYSASKQSPKGMNVEKFGPTKCAKSLSIKHLVTIESGWGSSEGTGGMRCNYSHDIAKCQWKGDDKHKCSYCKNNKSIQTAIAYHDNMGTEYDGPGTFYTYKDIKEVKMSGGN